MRQPAIATEGNKVKITPQLLSNQAQRHVLSINPRPGSALTKSSQATKTSGLERVRLFRGVALKVGQAVITKTLQDRLERRLPDQFEEENIT
jgi:hypothetical protein